LFVDLPHPADRLDWRQKRRARSLPFRLALWLFLGGVQLIAKANNSPLGQGGK